ncbi:crossover junction endodeoxyribonuclease RuvC [Candidatus Roizmanbacteria bacterium]|nr:crossover junction endodeoxyribonuclease RuvC [Candidatus Roizmanbacteria bacterium]
MTVLGIDPGIARCGWGVVEKNGSANLKTIDFGCVVTKSITDEAVRLSQLYEEIRRLIKKYKPDVVAVEKLFFAANVKTALTVGQARGAILVAAGTAGIPIAAYTPLEVKQAITGYGRAEKEQMQRMITKTLGLSQVPQPDDTADALAVAVTYCFMKNYDR